VHNINVTIFLKIWNTKSKLCKIQKNMLKITKKKNILFEKMYKYHINKYIYIYINIIML